MGVHFECASSTEVPNLKCATERALYSKVSWPRSSHKDVKVLSVVLHDAPLVIFSYMILYLLV